MRSRKTLIETMIIISVNSLRGSRPRMFFKTGIFKNFAELTGKHLFWSLFLLELSTTVFSLINAHSLSNAPLK